MTTHVHLAYLLRKEALEDLFSSEVLVSIPIEGQIRFLTSADMENAAAAGNVMLGVWLQEAANERILRFVRRSTVQNVFFPALTEDESKFRKLSFRMQTTSDEGGQETNVTITYVVDNDDCQVVSAGAPMGENWLALVIANAGNFELICKKGGVGPGGGPDPCVQLNCSGTDDWILKIKCISMGCPT